MQNSQKIRENIYWVGADDHRTALFENLFPLENGVSYNAYLILDDQTCLLDTADASVSAQFMENVAYVLGERTLDYLIIDHMEPDHCANIANIVAQYPEVTLVGSAKAIQFLHQFYEIEAHEKIVKEKDTLSLGLHTLQFIMAPFVHWPEVMLTYEQSEKILFSADAFGSFNALNGNLFNDEVDYEKDWLDEARRYYTNIVGKYGVQVQAALKKCTALEIAMIAPLHGLIWRNHLEWLLGQYQLWSTYTPETRSVVIFYGSMYGNTENAVKVLAGELHNLGVKDIKMYDVSSTMLSTQIAEVFRASHIVLASPTYNNEIYPAMQHLLTDLKMLNVQNRTFALVENGTWAPNANKLMKAQLETLKNTTILEESLTIKSSLKAADLSKVKALAKAIQASL